MSKNYPLFDGATFSARLDGARMGRRLRAVANLMADGKWRTVPEIVAEVGGSETGTAARVRDLRKPQHGGFHVDRRRRPGIDPRHGVWEFCLRMDTPATETTP